jgi:hypothetical protein
MRSLVFILLSLPVFVSGQNFRQAVIKTQTGGYLVFSDDTHAFTIHLDTAIIEPFGEQSTMYLIIDNTYVLQLFAIPFKNPENQDLLDDEVQKGFLAHYMKYESEYFRNDLNLSLTNLKTKWGTINLRRFLNWEFETPEFETIEMQIHLTTICFDNFVNINVPVTPGMPRDEAFAFIQYVASRLELHDYPIDFDVFAKEVNGLD